jgi:uncharacterized RDD family membrane protein YckC
MASLPPNLSPAPMSDQLTIETPEQTSIQFAVSGIGSRFLALTIDTLIQLAFVALGVLVVAFASAGLHLAGRAGPWLGAVALLLLFLVFYGYFIFFEAIWNGQTPGKRIIRIRVIKNDGRPIRTIESVGRNLLRIVDQLPFFYGFGIITVLLTKKSQRLGDLVAATMVVHEQTLEELKPVWRPAVAGDGPKLGSERLPAEDLALVEAFLNRRSALAADIRYNTAAQIVARLRPKLQIPAGINYRNEDLLEAIAAERRSSARYT